MASSVENLSSSLVREYLSRKGLKDTLSKLDDELPRTSESISNRAALAKAVKIDKLMKQNKELPNPYQSMIEIIVDFLINSSPQSNKRLHASAPPLNSNSISFPPTIFDGAPHDKDTVFGSLSNFEGPPRDNLKREDFQTISASDFQSVPPSDFQAKLHPNSGNTSPSRLRSGDLKHQAGPSGSSVLRSDKSLELLSRPRSLSPSRPTSGERSHDDTTRSKVSVNSITVTPKGSPVLGLLTGAHSRHEDKKLLSRGVGSVLPSATPSASSADSDPRSTKRVGSGINRHGLGGPSSTTEKKTIKHRARKVKLGSKVRDWTRGERSDKLSPESNSPLLDPPSNLLFDENQSSVSSQATHHPHSTSPSSASGVSGVSSLGVTGGTESGATGGTESVMLFEDLEDVDVNVDLTAKALHGGNKLERVTLPPNQSITPLQAKKLRQILFGDLTTGFNAEWTQQDLTFSKFPKLEYGLIQRKGGPCGTLAALQAHIIKHLLFDGPDKGDITKRLRPSAEARQKALVTSITEILWRAGAGGSNQVAVVALPSQGNRGATASYRHTDIIDQLTLVFLEDKRDLREFVRGQLEVLMEEHGCVLFTASVIFSRGFPKIQGDMDDPSSHLIGAHGYCTQELVNLILTGKATSNVFDGIVSLDSGSSHQKSILKGIGERSDIGFLSLFEHYKSCEVGEHYKNPRYPVYVVCSESHFLVLFGTNKTITDPRSMEKEFDLYYYDGLANQQDEIRLTIRVNAKTGGDANDLVPPIEHCIRTRWKHSLIDWNGSEQLL